MATAWRTDSSRSENELPCSLSMRCKVRGCIANLSATASVPQGPSGNSSLIRQTTSSQRSSGIFSSSWLKWRRRSESNRRWRSCSPLHYHFATAPITLSFTSSTNWQNAMYGEAAILGVARNKSTTYLRQRLNEAKLTSSIGSSTRLSLVQPRISRQNQSASTIPAPAWLTAVMPQPSFVSKSLSYPT